MQLREVDRPALEAEPRARAQIDRIERLAPACPHVGGAAEACAGARRPGARRPTPRSRHRTGPASRRRGPGCRSRPGRSRGRPIRARAMAMPAAPAPTTRCRLQGRPSSRSFRSRNMAPASPRQSEIARGPASLRASTQPSTMTTSPRRKSACRVPSRRVRRAQGRRAPAASRVARCRRQPSSVSCARQRSPRRRAASRSQVSPASGPTIAGSPPGSASAPGARLEAATTPMSPSSPRRVLGTPTGPSGSESPIGSDAAGLAPAKKRPAGVPARPGDRTPELPNRLPNAGPHAIGFQERSRENVP